MKDKAQELIEIFGKELAIKAVEQIMIVLQDPAGTDYRWSYWDNIKKKIEGAK